MGFFSRKEKKTENKDALNVENIESNSEVFEKKIETSKKTEKKSGRFVLLSVFVFNIPNIKFLKRTFIRK